MVTTRGSERKRSLEADDSGHSAKKAEPNRPKDSGDPNKPQIFTIGHGTRSLDELVSILRSAGVTRLVDVRSIPMSRTNPQFNRETLQASSEFQAQGLKYTWLGTELGGRRNSKQPGVEQHTAIRVVSFRNYAGYMCTSTFKEGLQLLENMGDEDAGTENGFIAIMCSETLWWRCHRRMISDMLLTRGWDVRHLGIGKEPMMHKMWDISRKGSNGELIYDGG